MKHLFTLISLCAIIGCQQPNHSQIPIKIIEQQPENFEWEYYQADWQNPVDRLAIALDMLRDIDTDIAKLKQDIFEKETRQPHLNFTKEYHTRKAEYNKARVQLLIYIASEADNIKWNFSNIQKAQ